MSRLFLVALRRRFVVWLVAATLLAFGAPLGGPALAQSDRAAGSAREAEVPPSAGLRLACHEDQTLSQW